jgi:hypothetical protein
MSCLRNYTIPETNLGPTYATVWSGYTVLVYALFRLSSDDVVIGLFNGGEEVMTFDLASMKSDFKMDINTLTDPIMHMYSSGRWCLDLRKLEGLYPEGASGIDIKLKSKSGTKTLDCAMIVTRARS